jgi:hypothetical protein
MVKDVRTATAKFQITGPLSKENDGYAPEVREFIPLNLDKDPYGRK